MREPRVTAVHADAEHRFGKIPQPAIVLLEGLGVQGDAHAGVTVQHRSRVARDPSQPNLRQVHLLHAELFETLAAAGRRVGAGELGENITTQGLDLLALPTGTALAIGESAVVVVTGLRNPCVQIDRFQPGLMGLLLDRDADGALVRKGGVMGVVRHGGVVRPGDRIVVTPPAGAPRPLQPV